MVEKHLNKSPLTRSCPLAYEDSHTSVGNGSPLSTLSKNFWAWVLTCKIVRVGSMDATASKSLRLNSSTPRRNAACSSRVHRPLFRRILSLSEGGFVRWRTGCYYLSPPRCRGPSVVAVMCPQDSPALCRALGTIQRMKRRITDIFVAAAPTGLKNE